MELRQLRYFLAVAEEQHFTRAAEKLFVSQPALSQQIRSLEQELGVELLDRSGRKIRTTPAGEIVRFHAQAALNQLSSMDVALGELAGLQRGSLAIGAAQTVNAYLLPHIVAAFSSTYPAITLQVEERAADEIESGVLDGTLQLGISFVPPSLGEIEAVPLFSEQLVVIVAQGHPWYERSEMTVRELDGAPMVMLSPAFCTRRLWDACAAEAAICPKVIVELNTVGGVLAALRQMAAVTVLPALAVGVDGQQEGLRGVRLTDPTPARTVGLLFRRGAPQCSATRAFTALVQNAVAAHIPDEWLARRHSDPSQAI